MITTPVADILLIENNPEEAELTKSAILKSKLTGKIHWVKDGEEALQFIFGQGKYLGRKVTEMPRIIILSLNISKVCGLEVLKIIKENPVTNKIIIISLSKPQEIEIFSEAINAGANICMTKTTDIRKFAELLNHELSYYWRLFENQ